jgi:hypothetical protein
MRAKKFHALDRAATVTGQCTKTANKKFEIYSVVSKMEPRLVRQTDWQMDIISALSAIEENA